MDIKTLPPSEFLKSKVTHITGGARPDDFFDFARRCVLTETILALRKAAPGALPQPIVILLSHHNPDGSIVAEDAKGAAADAVLLTIFDPTRSDLLLCGAAQSFAKMAGAVAYVGIIPVHSALDDALGGLAIVATHALGGTRAWVVMGEGEPGQWKCGPEVAFMPAGIGRALQGLLPDGAEARAQDWLDAAVAPEPPDFKTFS